MYVKKLILANFKSFAGANNVFEFSEGINYLVGNNNCGKSTVLEAINFVRNGLSYGQTVETIKLANYTGDDCYVELTFAGGVRERIDALKLKKAKAIKESIQEVDGEEVLVVRRYFTDGDEVKKFRFYSAPNDDSDTSSDKKTKRSEKAGTDRIAQEDNFINISGIDTDIKKLFDPTMFTAEDTPSAILDFSGTKLLGKLIDKYSAEFEQSDEWTALTKMHKEVFNDKFANEISILADKITSNTCEQFGNQNIKVSFDFGEPDTRSYIKLGQLKVDDGIADTELSTKGNGLQRAIAFAAIRAYAESTKRDSTSDNSIADTSNLSLCIDEPEIWMHPKAQRELGKALSDISMHEQIWVSTHSPYILQYFNKGNKDKLFIFKIVSAADGSVNKNIKELKDLGEINRGCPTLAEITYKAFEIPTFEYHNELFTILHDLLKKNRQNLFEQMNEQGVNVPGDGSINFVNFAFRKLAMLWEDPNEKDMRLRIRTDWGNKIIQECLPVCIRNLIDHPFADHDIKRAYFKIKENPDRLSIGEGNTSIRIEELERFLAVQIDQQLAHSLGLENLYSEVHKGSISSQSMKKVLLLIKVSDEDLAKSIEIMSYAIRQIRKCFGDVAMSSEEA